MVAHRKSKPKGLWKNCFHTFGSPSPLQSPSTKRSFARTSIETELPSRRLKPRSLEDRLSNIQNIHRDWPGLKNLRIRSIRESDCKGWLGRRLKQPKHSEQRVNNDLDTLKQILDLAVREGIIVRSPAANLKRLRIPKRELACLKDQDVNVRSFAAKALAMFS